jgi:putative N-acetyltransferase (TIGR04045 family)
MLTFDTRVARSASEHDAYFALRRAIFCDEQQLFDGDDRDDCDAAAIPIVCMAGAGDESPRVVGVVRIWEESPGDWWGGRLGVDPDFRTVGAIGRWLVQTAVGTARAWGAHRFRATVQRANVPFFRRLRWETREEIDLFGRPHHLMEAMLEHFSPTDIKREPSEGSRTLPTMDSARQAELRPRDLRPAVGGHAGRASGSCELPDAA